MLSRLLFLSLVAACLAAQVRNVASYAISARLNPADKSVTGREILTWINDSPDTVSELRFHLYMNAFKNTKSTFMRESGGQLRGDRYKDGAWGFIEVKRMQIVGGADLTKSIQFISPDDGNRDDQTVIRVPLPQPAPPGGQVRLEIDFYTRFPHVYARTGYHGDFYLGGQWFPKIGVWEKAGMRYATAGQWNCHQFHANSEFYADFGTYAVDLTAPSNFVVGATGVLRKEQKNIDGTTTHFFYQENVHDFAWTAQPTYRKFVRTFSADRAVPADELARAAEFLGIPPDEARLGDVQMILLLQPEHASQADRHFRAVENALKYFGLWYGRYPHATITVVDPPAGGGGAGGMEYPAFITAGTSWLTGKNDGSPEFVTVHEFGHQYWQGIVASNEFEEAWMDEGFNTYSTGKVMERAYGAINLPVTILVPLSRVMTVPQLEMGSVDRGAYLMQPKTDDLFRPAWGYQNGSSYSLNSYMRTGVMLRTLEGVLGARTMARVMRGYFQRWKFGHPAAPDFIRVVNEVSGRDMNWFFRQFLYSSNVLDYSVASVDSNPVEEGSGIFGEGAQRKAVGRKQVEEKKGDAKSRPYRTRVTVRREGEAVAPVEVVVRFENGEVEMRNWDGEYRWTKFEFVKKSRPVSVVVDPDRRLWADVDWTNNSWRRSPHLATTAKWTSALLFWVQQILQTLSLLA